MDIKIYILLPWKEMPKEIKIDFSTNDFHVFLIADPVSSFFKDCLHFSFIDMTILHVALFISQGLRPFPQGHVSHAYFNFFLLCGFRIIFLSSKLWLA